MKILMILTIVISGKFSSEGASVEVVKVPFQDLVSCEQAADVVSYRRIVNNQYWYQEAGDFGGVIVDQIADCVELKAGE